MPVTARLLSGFDDPALDRADWDALLNRSETNVAYLTRLWQSTWWETVGCGTLLLIAAEDNGRTVALAPLYSHEGIVFFIGTGDADYLDIIGDVTTPGVVDAIIDVAAASAPKFCGIRLFAIKRSCSLGPLFQKAAESRGWLCYAKSGSAAPRLDLVTGRDRAIAAATGPKVTKRDRYFSESGSLELQEASDPTVIDRHLDTLIDQHIERWAAAGVTSRLAADEHRRFMHTAVRRAGPPLQPRLTWLEWQGRAIACEFGWIYRNTYFAVVSSFAPDLASRSPGQVLQRRIVLAALRDGLEAYDFGHGDYPYKLNYATEVHDLDTWHAYPETRSDDEARS